VAPRTARHHLAQLDARLLLKLREMAEAADPDDLASKREELDDLLDQRFATHPVKVPA